MFAKRPMQATMIMCCTLWLASCTTPARTISELRLAKSSMIKEEFTINREYAQVVSDVRRKSAACLELRISKTVQNGVNYSQNTFIYHPKVKTVGNGKAEMTLQWDRLPRAEHDPSGGYYIFLTDIERVAPNKTRLTQYGSSYFTSHTTFDAVKAWGEGKNLACPDGL